MSDRILWSVENLDLTIGFQLIFKNALFSIGSGERVALVGRNGCGKSTLLSIISGSAQIPQGAKITQAKNLRIAVMPQNFTDRGKTVEEVLREGLSFFTEAVERFSKLSPDSKEHEALEAFLLLHDAWNTDMKMKTAAQRLGITDLTKKCACLSGGELRRVLLARAILAEPDLLLLDEPTNHLDIGTVAKIEEFLSSYKGACLFVTHDRFFLDRIATRIVELDHGSFFSCDGSYADFLAAKEEREYAEDLAENRRKSFLRREIEWVRRSPKARLRRNLGRLKRYDEIAAQSGPVRTGNIDLVIPKASRLGNRVADFKNVSYSIGGKELLKDFSFEFSAGMKVGIIGPNGAGKTTFLKILTHQIPPDSGEIFTAQSVEFNYIDQARVALDPEKTIVEEIGEGHENIALGDERISIWGYLKRFMFEDERINTKIKYLSGGERARLTLAKILRGGGNFLILDEPTNDLDLPTLRILEESLADYDGCLALVSHDRYFLNRICTHIIAFEEDGQHTETGDFDYYDLKKRERLAAAEPEARTEKPLQKAPEAPKKIKLTYRQEKELEALEVSIAEKEARIAEIESTFSDPDFYEKHGGETVLLQQESEETKRSLEADYARWEELESIREASKK